MSKVVTFISEHKHELASRLIFVVFITIILEHTFGALESIILAILFTLLISTLLPSISTLFLKDTAKFQKIMAAIKLMLISAMFYGISVFYLYPNLVLILIVSRILQQLILKTIWDLVLRCVIDFSFR